MKVLGVHDPAIAAFLGRSARSKADQLRDQAAALLAEADRLDGRGAAVLARAAAQPQIVLCPR